jgi:hypothetical protein
MTDVHGKALEAVGGAIVGGIILSGVAGACVLVLAILTIKKVRNKLGKT